MYVCCLQVTARLGCSREGAKDIREHDWFGHVDVRFDWEKLARGEMEAPWVPKLSGEMDDSMFTENDVPSEIVIQPYTGRGEWCVDF